MLLKGISVSEGFAKGRIHFLDSATLINTDFQGTETELTNLQQSLDLSKAQIQKLIEKLKSESKFEEAEIFSAHILMVEDPEILNQVQTKIKTEKISAGAAYHKVLNEFIQMFLDLNDEYMKQRATDLKDIQSRVLSNLSFKDTNLTFTEDVLLFASRLSLAIS